MQFLVNPKTKQKGRTVKIYGEKNFEGPAQELEAGIYNAMQLSIGGNKIGSLKISECMRVVLRQNPDSQGESKIFTNDVSDLAEVSAAEAASLIVQPVVTVYGEPDYKGACENFTVGRHNADHFPIFKNRALSMKIPEGMMITFFKDSEWMEPVAFFSENTSLMTDGFDFDAANISGVAVEAAAQGSSFGSALNFGDIVALKFGGEKFARMKDDGSLSADSDYIGENSEFTVVRSGDSRHTKQISFGDCVSLKSRDDKYLKVDQDAGVFAVSQTVSAAEKFIIWRSGDTLHTSFASGDDIISLQSFENKRFVSSDERISANSDKIGAGEKWQIIISQKTCPQTRF